MNKDETGRLSHTLNAMRVCRLFNYKFIAVTSIDALETELERLQHIPGLTEIMRNNILVELPLNKKLAEREILKDEPKEFWKFFDSHQLNLTETYAAAKKVALITPSSCSSERVFAQCAYVFNELTCNALEDRREASIIFRMNDNWRRKENM